jgi:peroxiredoxin
MKKIFATLLILTACTITHADTIKAKPTFKQKVELTFEKVSNKFSELLAKLNIVGKFETYGKKMAKQNETVVENAAVGVHTQVAKRNVSTNEKVRQIQENLDKVAADKIKKYDSVE